MEVEKPPSRLGNVEGASNSDIGPIIEEITGDLQVPRVFRRSCQRTCRSLVRRNEKVLHTKGL